MMDRYFLREVGCKNPTGRDHEGNEGRLWVRTNHDAEERRFSLELEISRSVPAKITTFNYEDSFCEAHV